MNLGHIQTERAVRPLNAFQSELQRAMLAKMRELKKEGTTAMGKLNFRMIVRAPSNTIDGAPSVIGYPGVFTLVLEATPQLRNFIL